MEAASQGSRQASIEAEKLSGESSLTHKDGAIVQVQRKGAWAMGG